MLGIDSICRELEDRLRVVGHRAIGVDRDRDRPHAEEPERDQAEGEDRGRDHQVAALKIVGADAVGDGHQRDDAHPEPVGAEIPRHEARQDVERCAALSRRGHDFPDVAGLGGREDLDELGNDRPGERAAGDDGRELPPEIGVAAEVRDEPVRGDVGEDDRDNRRQPDQSRQRHLEIHRLGVAEARFRPHVVEQVRRAARDDHDDAHHEDPDQQLHLDSSPRSPRPG